MAFAKEKYDQLIRDGYCLFENILDAKMLDRLRTITDQLLDAQSEQHFEAQRSTGSMISVHDDSFFAELVTYPKALEALAALGFDEPKWRSGFVISKPPHSPPLFWHQDWWGWDDPDSYTAQPLQVFLMYYLVDTNRHNGCLRVIPGSHLKRHPVHDQVPDAHTDELRRVTNPNHPAYNQVPDEVDIPVKAGDLVIGDARILHAAWGNQSVQRRTVLTLWYHPDFSASPERIQASIMARQRSAESWSEHARALVKPLLPVYEGNVEPITWNRVPGADLQ